MKRIILSLLLVCILCTAAQAETTVTIFDGSENAFLEQYQTEHDDINIDFQWPQVWGDALISELMTNPNYDIFELPIGRVFVRLMEEGYLVPIEDAHALAWLETAYPALKAVLCYDGKLYGLPVPDDIGSPIVAWAYSPEDVEDAGLSELPNTWTELLNLMADWDWDNPYQVFENYGILTLTETIISDYILRYDVPGEIMTFDTPAFRNTMEALKRWKEAEAPADNRPALIMMYPIYLNPDGGDKISNEIQFIAPMTFMPEEEPIITVDLMRIWCISRRTKNLNLTLELIANAASKMPEHIRSITVPDMIEAKDNYITQDTADNLNQLMQHFTISSGAIIGDYKYEIIDEVNRYLDGNISLEMLVEILDNLVEMITLERS